MKYLTYIRCTFGVLAFLLCMSCSALHHEQPQIAQSKELSNPIKPIVVNRHWIHNGNKKLDISKLKYEIYQISKTLPNIQYSKNLSNLIVETIAVETNLGQSNYLKNDHITRNYGLGQFVLSTAKHILKVQKRSDPKTYHAMMKYYDHSMSLKDNVRKNVKFTIALQLEYYKMCDKNINKNISTVYARAKVWKKHYNTVHGSGTVQSYIATVRRHLGNRS